MNMMERHHLLQPLIPAAAAAVPTPSNATVISRLAFVFFVAIISIWANHEASKGFAVTVVNEAGNTPAGERFSLFYQSNDKATRVILSTSKLVENLLYLQYPSDDDRKKQVNGVVLRLRRNATTETAGVEVEHSDQTHHEFTLHLNPLLMEQPNFEFAVYSAVLHGMARVWVWDGQGHAPRLLVHAVVEYISSRAGAGFDRSHGQRDIIRSDGTAGGLPEDGSNDCFNGDNLTEFLDFCEREKPGFVRRLNAGMRERWQDDMVDDALGMPAQHLCASFVSFR